MSIYIPAEDSFLFSEFLKEYLSKNKVSSYLDMGTGSGILSETVSEFLDKKNILAVDIDEESFEFVKNKGFKVLQSNLFSKISKNKKFDLITLNAPYLPLEEGESKDSQRITTGGKKGDEISLKFLKQAKTHLNKDGKIFLLISSLTPMSKIKKYSPKVVAERSLFMEKLFILEFSN
ncbi:Release factor glutamine methyltransferase [uncultured archaeon]|nr:Release factor glutamine methyltransferase [uncultured archaeon]